jgi:hypothetical protein
MTNLLNRVLSPPLMDALMSFLPRQFDQNFWIKVQPGAEMALRSKH